MLSAKRKDAKQKLVIKEYNKMMIITFGETKENINTLFQNRS